MYPEGGGDREVAAAADDKRGCNNNNNSGGPNTGSSGKPGGPAGIDAQFDGTPAFFSAGRPLMSKLCFRELLLREVRLRPSPELPRPRVFSEPRCQSGAQRLSGWYLLYRVSVLSAWLTIVVCSIFELGASKPVGGKDKWPIYLTNWDLALGSAQAALGLLLVVHRLQLQRAQPNFSPDLDLPPELGRLERAYWFLYVTTSSVALGVTATYWVLVHDPRIHQVDLLNLMLHVGNSLLMLGDIAVTNVPFELRQCCWGFGMTLVYLGFSVVYYLAGGLDKHGQRRIYAVLDWARPCRTLAICSGGLLFVVFVHCLLCALARLKERCYLRWETSRAQRDELAGSGRMKHTPLLV